MTDFSAPHRMSPSAFVIIFIKSIKSIIGTSILLIFANIYDADSIIGNVWLRILAILAISAALALMVSFAQYYHKKFYIKDGYLIFTHGIIQRETASIPLDRIHSLRTKQGVWYRLLDLKGIVIDTLALREEEIELILDEGDWQRLLQRIRQEEQPKATTEPPAYRTDTVRRFANKNLLLDALCQNHLKGMAILGGFLSIIFGHLNDIPYNTFDIIDNYAESYFDEIAADPLRIVPVLATVYVIVLLLWIGRALLRYYDMSLTYDRKLLTFTHGLLSRASSRFAFDKVCTIWVKRNFLEKRFGLCTLRLRQALNVTAKKEEDNLKLYGADSSSFFLAWWLGEDYRIAPDIITSKSGKGVFVHSLLPDLLLSVAATAVLCYFNLYVWTSVPAIYLLISVVKGIMAMRHSKITLKDSYIVVYGGRFAEIENYIKYRNIEVVKIRSTPFTRWFHRVTLSISTAGSNFSVRSLKVDEAKLIYELLLFKAESTSDNEF